MENKITILYIDDELNNLTSFSAVFRTQYDVLTALSGNDAKNILKSNEVQIIIVDQSMPDMTGVELLESIVEEFPDPIRILLTGHKDMNIVIDAINKGKIFHYLTKPWNEDELAETIRRAHEMYKQRKDERFRISQLSHKRNMNLIFDKQEFNTDEIAEIILQFSKLYQSIGGDEIEIKKAELLQLVDISQFELI